MGRHMKRVAMDFDWPLKKIWKGYLNPHYKECRFCCGRGSTEAYYRFDNFTRYLAIAAEDASIWPEGFQPRPVTSDQANRQAHVQLRSQPTSWPWPEHDIVETFAKASGWSVDDFSEEMKHNLRVIAGLETPETFVHYEYILLEGYRSRRNFPHPYMCELGVHNLANSPFDKLLLDMGAKPGPLGFDRLYNAQKAIFKAVGLPCDTDEKGYESFSWTTCKVCNGEGINPKVREAYEAWEDYEPPEGEGYQLWETTSEGSPVSPVFKTFDELCSWCEHNASTFGTSNFASKEEWAKMLDNDFVYHQEGNMVFM